MRLSRALCGSLRNGPGALGASERWSPCGRLPQLEYQTILAGFGYQSSAIVSI